MYILYFKINRYISSYDSWSHSHPTHSSLLSDGIAYFKYFIFIIISIIKMLVLKFILLLCLIKIIATQKGSLHGCFNKNNDNQQIYDFDGTVDGCMTVCEDNFFR